ncbi:hypothetical protein CORC01_12993 [Colletotrichum orchidophilum]|uniref:Uncharacterized protein n=1 Tax=Colletotrichum orchidophilum TaxID=1209926 RepID=A0A1G4ARQ8_9PEZI|nr:uncharacterized protein CORC01_12993 [Colletotrichum orchidophilum]OHE91702.1 hypothetical protein CORC01_12993 [Colletotrichum orchidophilum]
MSWTWAVSQAESRCDFSKGEGLALPGQVRPAMRIHGNWGRHLLPFQDARRIPSWWYLAGRKCDSDRQVKVLMVSFIPQTCEDALMIKIQQEQRDVQQILLDTPDGLARYTESYILRLE